MTETKTDLTVANNIRSQLHKACVMLGAYNFLGDADSLTFAIRGSKRVTHIKVKLLPEDTYEVTFLKLSRARLAIHARCETVSQHAGVYVDGLSALIANETGLATSL